MNTTHITLISLVLLFAVAIWYIFLLPSKKANAEENYFVRVITASIGPAGQKLWTFHLKYPRFIHSEMMTHKDFSRSATSSRAIPVSKMLSQVWNNPAVPLYFGKNQAGMQAFEQLSVLRGVICKNIWVLAGRTMCVFVWGLMKIGLHKQTANRLLEPWQLMQVTLTTAKLENFFHLRIHPDAQPEICHLAKLMKYQVEITELQPLKLDEYHLPWITEFDKRGLRHEFGDITDQHAKSLLLQASAARCARSSYANFYGNRATRQDLETFEKLVKSKPVHASPCEHQATPDFLKPDNTWQSPELHGNLPGWIQHRKLIPDHYKEDK